MESQLDNLKTFGKEGEGHYSDRWQFSIIKSKHPETHWNFFFFCEIDGSLYFIKRLKDMDDLKNVYKAITDKELE